jgi:hypothetical protein
MDMKLNYTVSCLALALMLPALPAQAQTSDPASTSGGCESGMFDAQGACIENAGEAANDDDSDDSTIVPGENNDDDEQADDDQTNEEDTEDPAAGTPDTVPQGTDASGDPVDGDEELLPDGTVTNEDPVTDPTDVEEGTEEPAAGEATDTDGEATEPATTN